MTSKSYNYRKISKNEIFSKRCLIPFGCSNITIGDLKQNISITFPWSIILSNLKISDLSFTTYISDIYKTSPYRGPVTSKYQKRKFLKTSYSYTMISSAKFWLTTKNWKKTWDPNQDYKLTLEPKPILGLFQNLLFLNIQSPNYWVWKYRNAFTNFDTVLSLCKIWYYISLRKY